MDKATDKKLASTDKGVDAAAAGVAKNAKAQASLLESLQAVNLTVATLAGQLGELKQDASAAKDPLAKASVYWLALDKSTLATNEPAFPVNVVGAGFDAYFNPLFPPFYECTCVPGRPTRARACAHTCAACVRLDSPLARGA